MTIKFEFKGASLRGGVYCIRNSHSKKAYYGSTVCFLQRARTHAYLLDSGRHFNVALQRAYDKYGAETLTFTVLIVEDDPTQHGLLEVACIKAALSAGCAYNMGLGPTKLAGQAVATREKIKTRLREYSSTPAGKKALARARAASKTKDALQRLSSTKKVWAKTRAGAAQLRQMAEKARVPAVRSAISKKHKALANTPAGRARLHALSQASQAPRAKIKRRAAIKAVYASARGVDVRNAQSAARKSFWDNLTPRQKAAIRENMATAARRARKRVLAAG